MKHLRILDSCTTALQTLFWWLVATILFITLLGLIIAFNIFLIWVTIKMIMDVARQFNL